MTNSMREQNRTTRQYLPPNPKSSYSSFHLGGHGQHDGAERVAGGADGVGSLLGMS